MIEFALAIAVLLLLALQFERESRRYGEEAETLGHITEWMKCQEKIDGARDRQIEILTNALTRSQDRTSSEQK